MEKTCSTHFHEVWRESVKENQELLSGNWRKNPVYTNNIFSQNGILDSMAQKLGLLYYPKRK